MINVLQMVAHASIGSGGRRGVNGPELRTLNALPLFDRDHFNITLTYSHVGRLWDAFRETGVPVIDFAVGGKLDRRSVRQICQILRDNKIDVVHTQGPGSLDLYATKACKRVNTKIIVTRPVMISDLKLPWWRRIGYALFDHYTLSNADKLIAVCRAGREHLINRRGVPATKIELVYNGVDISRFRPQSHPNRLRFDLADNVPVVGAAAQLTHVKGWQDFLYAVCRLRKHIPQVHGLVIGDGPMRAELEELAGKLGVADVVRFTGHLSDVQEALNCLDLYLFMSHREGLSVAIIESLACGLPGVITEVGGARELVEDGLNGFVIQTGDVNQAVAHASELLRNPELLKRMGKESRKRCESRFVVDSMVRAYERVYESVTGAA